MIDLRRSAVPAGTVPPTGTKPAGQAKGLIEMRNRSTKILRDWRTAMADAIAPEVQVEETMISEERPVRARDWRTAMIEMLTAVRKSRTAVTFAPA